MIAGFIKDVGIALIVLGIIIVIHELGHFLVAKLFKIKVETFSVGFGPRLFGYRYGDTDYRSLLSRQPLNVGHREAFLGAVDVLAARPTGTGLYDTILAAYTAGRDGYREGIANHVIVFTDGRNEDDVNSISAEELTARLTESADPARPVILTVMTFGPEPEAEVLATAIEPVDGYVEELSKADEVRATLIHQTAGGLHH